MRAKAKLSPEQLEGLADALVDVFDGDIATKADIRDVQTNVLDVQADIQVVRGDVGALKIRAGADIKSSRLTTQAGIDGLRLETEADIEAVQGATATAKVETVRRLVGAIGFQTLVVLSAVVARTRTLH